MTDYGLLLAQLGELRREEPFYVPFFSNAAALLWQTLPDINWVGFYLMREGRLVVGPFQGKPACIHIEPGKGVCGAAVYADRTLRVADVHQFPGHIACDAASRSEIVIPLHSGGRIAAVLDIDSPVASRFSQHDEAGLASLSIELEKAEYL